jgi:hypothetical protein
MPYEAPKSPEVKAAMEIVAQLQRIADSLDTLLGRRKLADIAAEMLPKPFQTLLVEPGLRPEDLRPDGPVVTTTLRLPELTPFASPESLITKE